MTICKKIAGALLIFTLLFTMAVCAAENETFEEPLSSQIETEESETPPKEVAEGQRKSVNGKAGNNRMMPGGMGEGRIGEGEAPPWGEGMPPNAGFPGEGRNGGMNGRFFGNEQTVSDTPEGFIGFVKEYQTPLISVGLLAGAFVFVIFYKRKNY